MPLEASLPGGILREIGTGGEHHDRLAAVVGQVFGPAALATEEGETRLR
jgi:hypothetical protein